MKTLQKIKRSISLLGLTALLIVGCSPEDGDQGPAGPAGPQGEQGPVGQDGEQGEQGNANVIVSDWIENGFSTGGGLLQKLFSLATTEDLTALNVNLEQSAVLVYGRANILLANGTEIFPLPYYDAFNDDRYTYTINDGSIRAVGLTSNDGSNDFDRFDDYRYIIIPADNSQSGKQTPPDYTKMSYDEIVKLFGIKD